MGAVLVVLLIALLLGGLGFFTQVLWFGAVIVAIFWVAGFAFRGGQGARWYRW